VNVADGAFNVTLFPSAAAVIGDGNLRIRLASPFPACAPVWPITS
jgi:hypothetical protein